METTVDQLILITGVGINALLGVAVLLFNRGTVSSKLFLLNITLIIGWIIANHNIDASTTNQEALLWLRILYTCAIGYIAIFYIFSIYFPYRQSSSKQFPTATHGALLYAFIMGSVTLFSDKVFATAVVGQEGLEALTVGPLQSINNYVLLAIAVAGAYQLEKKRSEVASATTKKQIRIVVIGWSIFIIATVIIGGILPNYIPILVNLTKAIPLTSIVMVGFTTYAILKYQFLDIRVVIQRGLVYSALLVIIVGFYIILLHAFDLLIIETTQSILISALTTTVVGIFTVPGIERYFRRVTDPLFFKDRYDYADALFALSQTTNEKLILEDIVQDTERALREILRAKDVSLLTYSSDEVRESQISFEVDRKKTATIPIMIEDRLIGSIVLGEKLSGDFYTEEDTHLLQTFSHHVAVAIEKARLYKEVEDYSHELEKRVEERTAEVRGLQEAQQQMLIDISHNLQNPLTIVKGRLGLLKEEPLNDEEILTFERSIDEISTFIYNLLHLTRLEAQVDKVEMGSFSLSECLEELVEYYSIILSNEQIGFSYAIQPNLVIKGNRERLKDLVNNLMSNAVKYIGNGPEKSIHLILKQNGSNADLIVRDTGVGIRTEDLPYIFDRFYRIKNNRRSKVAGTGLGLAICRSIAELHNGGISATSVLGAGSTFTVSLPLANKVTETQASRR